MPGHLLNNAVHFLQITLPVTLIFLGLGGFFLYDSVSNNGHFQAPEVIGGASLVALGLIVAYPQLRMALKWRHAGRADSERNW